jgi:hypothetical protein
VITYIAVSFLPAASSLFHIDVDQM